MQQLRRRKNELEARPVVEAGWIEEDQGMTFLQLWPTLDLDGKRKQLIRSGFRMMIGSKTTWLDRVPLGAEEEED